MKGKTIIGILFILLTVYAVLWAPRWFVISLLVFDFYLLFLEGHGVNTTPSTIALIVVQIMLCGLYFWFQPDGFWAIILIFGIVACGIGAFITELTDPTGGTMIGLIGNLLMTFCFLFLNFSLATISNAFYDVLLAIRWFFNSWYPLLTVVAGFVWYLVHVLIIRRFIDVDRIKRDAKAEMWVSGWKSGKKM